MCVADAHRISSENEEMECLLEMWGFILQHESNEREYSQTLPTKSVGDLSQRIQSHATRNHFSIASPRTLKDLIRVRTSSSFSGINQEEAAFASLLQMRLEPLMAAHTATTTIPDRLVRDAFIDGYRLYRAWRGVCITGASYAVGPRGFGASGGMMLGRPDSHAEMQWESLGAGPAVNPPTSVVSIRSGTAPLSERLLVSPIAFLTTDIMPCVVPQSIIQVEQARGAKSIPHRGGGRTTTAVAPPKKKPTVGGDSRWLVAEALYRATGPVDEPPVHSRGGVNSQLLRQIARNIHAASNSKSKVVTPTPSNHAPTTGPDSVLYDVLAGYVPHLLEDGHSWGRHVEKQAQALAIRIVRGGKDRAPASTSRRGSIKRKSSGKRNSSGGRRRSSSGAGRRKSSGSGRRRSSQRVEETAPAADPDAVRAEAEERAKVEELFGPLSQWETVDSVNSIPYQLSAELRFANIAQTGIRTSDEVGRRCAELVFRRRMARRAIVSKLPANHSAHKCRDAWDAIRRSAHLTKFEAEAAQQLNNTDHQHPLTGKMSSHNISHSDMHSGTVPVLVSSRLPSDLLVVPFKPTFTDIHDEPPSQGSNERLVNVKSRIASHRHFGKSYSGFGGRADSSIATPTAAPRLLPTYVIDTSVGYARRIGALTSHPVVVNASSRHALFTTSTQETMHADEQHQVGAAASMSCLIARPVASPRRTTTMGRAGLSHGHHHSSGPSPLPTVVLEDAHKSLALSEFTGFDTAKLPTKPPKRRAASPLAVTQSAQPTYALLKALVGVSSTNTASRRAVSPTTPPSSKAESRAVSPSVPAGVEVGLLQVPNRSGLAPIIPPVDSLNVTTEVSEPTSPTGSVTTTQSKQITPTTVTTRRSEEPLQLLRSLHAAASGNPNAAVTSHCLLLGRSRRVAAASPLDTLRRVAFRVVRCQSLPMGLLEEAATCLATITGGLSSSPSSTRGGGADLDYKHIVRDLHAISVGSRHAHTTLDTLAVKSQAVPHSSIPPLQSALATKSAATMMRIFTGATCRHNSTTRLGGDGVGKYGLALSLKTARHCLDALRFAFTTNTTANGSNHHHSAHLAQSGRQLWLSMNRAYQSAVLFQEGVLPYISYTHSTLPHPPPTTTPSTLSSALSTSSPHQRPDRVKLLVEVLGALADQQDALLGFLLDTVVSEGLIEINKRECTSRVSWIEEGCAKMTQYTGGGHLPELATALSFIRCGFNATSGATILQGMRAGTASNTNNADAVSNRWLVHSPPIVKSGVDGGLNPSVVTASDQQAAADTALAKRPALFVTSVKTPGRTFIRRTVLQALLTSGVAPNQSSKGGLGVSTPTTPRHLGRSYSSVSGSNTGVFSLDDVFARHDMKVSGAATAAPSKKTTPLYPSSTLQSKVATIHGVQLNSPPEVLGVSLWGSRVAGGTGGGFHRSVLGSSPAMSPKGGSLVQLVTPIANNMSNIYANDALHGSRVRGGASGIREQLPEEVRYMQAQRHKLRTALTQSTESSPPSSTSSYTSSSAVNHLLSCTLVLTTLTGEPTVHTPPLFDSTSKDFAELISTYVKLRAIADNREAVGSLLRQRRVRTARRKAARTMQVSESTPSFALVDPSVETTALPWWATGNAINGPRGSVTQSSDAAGCRISTPLPTVIGLSGIEDANKHSTASKWLQVPPSLLPQPTLSSTASSGANLGGGGGTNNNDTTDLTPRGTPQWGAGGRDPLDYSFASVEGSEHIKSDGSISNHNNSPGASMSVDGGQSTSVQGGGLDSSSRSATPTPRTSIGKSGGGSLTPRSPGGTSISGARKMSRQGRKAVRGKSKATSAAQREQLTKSMWNAFQRRVVGSLETESLEASTGVHLAAFATFLANGITPNFTVLNAIAKGTSIPPSHLQLPPTTTSTAAQSTLGMGGGGSTIGLSRSASTAHSGRFSRSHVKSTSATSMKLTSQEKDFRLVSTSFDGPLPLSCHATAAPQQAMLWDCLRAQPDHPLRRADILIHNTAYPYRHRLSARYASLFLLEHSRRASGTLEASLYGLLCKRERDEKQRRSQEGTDVHDSQRGFGTLRSTFTTFGAYLEEFGEDDNPFSSGRHAIAMSTTDEEASPRLGGAHRSMKSASSFHSKEASPVDTFTPSQQQGYWLSRLSLGDERFAVGSVPMCSSSRARGPRYAKWDAEKLVAALGSVCTPYSAQDESRPTPPPSVGSARCQSTVLRAVYGEHPVHPSNEASILVDELDNVSNCDVSDDDAGSCVSSTTAFSSESEEEQGGIVQDFSAFPEPLQGADDADGTTISSDTSTSGSSYVYYSEGEPDYEEEAEEGSPSEDGGFMDGGAFGDEREGSLNHPSSDSSSSSRSDSSTTSTFVPTVKRDPESATSLEQLEKGEHAYLAGLRRTRKATLDAHRKVTRNKTKTLRDKLRVRRAGVSGGASGIKPVKKATPEGKCNNTNAAPKKKSAFTPLAQPTFTHRTAFGQSLSHRILGQIKFARSALCLRLLAHDVLVLSANREEKSIAKLIALRGGGADTANYAKPSDRATDAIAAAALTSARSRAFAPGTAADSNQGDASVKGPRDGPATSIVDGLDYYTDHPAVASSGTAASDVAAYPPELNAELLLCKLPTVNDLSRVLLNNTQPKPHPPKTATTTTPPSNVDDELWDVDDFIEALQQVVLSRYIVSAHH